MLLLKDKTFPNQGAKQLRYWRNSPAHQESSLHQQSKPYLRLEARRSLNRGGVTARFLSVSLPQCASKALCSQRQKPCHAVYNSPWMGKCVNSKTLSSLGNSKCVEEHLGCVPREEAAGGSGNTCLQVYEGLLLLHSSGLLCSFLAPYLTWAFDLLLWECQHFKDASEPNPAFPPWGLPHHTILYSSP